MRGSAVLAVYAQELGRLRLRREIVVDGAIDARPVGVVDDQQGLVGEMALDEPEAVELLLVAVCGVVVVDADAAAVERVAAESVEDVALEDARVRATECRKVLSESVAAFRVHGEVVDADEVALLAVRGGDQARALERAGLDVTLARGEQRRRRGDQRQVVRPREAADSTQDLLEERVARRLAVREVVEGARERIDEACGRQSSAIVPVVPSTRTRVPSGIAAVAPAAPTTAGIRYSRATTAA